MNLFALLILGAYCLIGLGLNFVIKILSKVYKFHFPVMIFFYQCLGIFIIATVILAIQDYRAQNGKTVMGRLAHNIGDFKNTYLLSVFYLMHGCFTTHAIHFISLPIYNAGRRCLVFFVILTNLVMCETHKINRTQIIFSLIITGSAVVAIAGDIVNGTPIGYFMLVMANFGTVLYSEYSGKLQKEKKMDSIELLQQNGMQTIVPCLILGHFNNDLHASIDYMSYEVDSSTFYQIVFVMAMMSILMFARQLALFLSTRHIQEGTFCIGLTGNIKDVFATGLSIILWNDVTLSLQVKLSLLMSFVGAFGYCVCKYQETKREKAKKMQDNDQSPNKVNRDIESALLKNEVKSP